MARPGDPSAMVAAIVGRRGFCAQQGAFLEDSLRGFRASNSWSYIYARPICDFIMGANCSFARADAGHPPSRGHTSQAPQALLSADMPASMRWLQVRRVLPGQRFRLQARVHFDLGAAPANADLAELFTRPAQRWPPSPLPPLASETQGQLLSSHLALLVPPVRPLPTRVTGRVTRNIVARRHSRRQFLARPGDPSAIAAAIVGQRGSVPSRTHFQRTRPIYSTSATPGPTCMRVRFHLRAPHVHFLPECKRHVCL